MLKIQSKFHERKHPQEKSIIPGNELFLECMLHSQYWLAAEINRIWVFLHRPLYQGWIEWIMYYTVHIQRCTFYGTRFFSLCCATFPYWKLMFAILHTKLKITCLSTNSPQIPVRKISFTTHEKQKSNEGKKAHKTISKQARMMKYHWMLSSTKRIKPENNDKLYTSYIELLSNLLNSLKLMEPKKKILHLFMNLWMLWLEFLWEILRISCLKIH